MCGRMTQHCQTAPGAACSCCRPGSDDSGHAHSLKGGGVITADIAVGLHAQHRHLRLHIVSSHPNDCCASSQVGERLLINRSRLVITHRAPANQADSFEINTGFLGRVRLCQKRSQSLILFTTEAAKCTVPGTSTECVEAHHHLIRSDYKYIIPLLFYLMLTSK